MRSCSKVVLVLVALLAVSAEAQITEAHASLRRQAAARRRQQAAAASSGTAGSDSAAQAMHERFPNSKPGTLDCLTDRSIPNWDSKESRVCDPSICNGSNDLFLQAPPDDMRQERFTSAQVQTYISDLRNSTKIEGWMVPVHAWLVGMLSRYQHRHGMFGAVGEIGVFQGKLFIALSGFAHPSEMLLAADWFDAFHYRGYLEKFQKNLDKYVGAEESKLTIYQGDSNGLTPRWFAEQRLPFFRLLSVDASHDLKLVLRDFNLAACLMMDGGIVIADDFGGESWMGVNSALYNFVFEQSRIVPFMMVANKLYLTTISHHEEYYNMLTNIPDVQCKDANEALTQVSMGDYRVCMMRHNRVGMADVDGLLGLLTSGSRSRQQ